MGRGSGQKGASLLMLSGKWIFKKEKAETRAKHALVNFYSVMGKVNLGKSGVASLVNAQKA